MTFDDFALARVLHVASIVGWIGGVWFVTFVVMPAINRNEQPSARLGAFHRIEQGFAPQARLWVLLAGVSGFWMTWRADLWARFAEPGFWWMHAMVCLWLLFVFILFVAGPFILHRRFHRWATTAPDVAFAWLHRVHWVLLVLALITVFGAAAGSHGWLLF